MAAQEFSSPGEHMSSIGSSSGSGLHSQGVIYAKGNDPNAPYFMPSIINNAFEDRGSAGSGSGSYFSGSGNLEDISQGLFGMMRDYIGSAMPKANNAAYSDIAEQQNAFNTTSARKAMEFSKQMAERQMQFQQYNADTSYQRAVKDLKAAGLSPILAAFNGGAPSPSGSSAQGIAANAASQGYDEGYTGFTSTINSLISNLPMLTIASFLTHNSGMKNLANTLGSTLNKLAESIDSFINGKPKGESRYSGVVTGTQVSSKSGKIYPVANPSNIRR